jgi:hypothetical protein
MSNYLENAPKEILKLHTMAESWFRGDFRVPPEEVKDFLDQLHPNFTMILPNGSTRGHKALTEMMEGAFGSKEKLEITIANIELRYASEEIAIFSYEAQLLDGNDIQRRSSTAVFTPAENGSPQWLHLRETLVE